MDCGRIKHRIDVFRKEKRQNEFGENTFDYALYKSVWAEIVPKSGREESIPGSYAVSDVTHKVTTRKGAIKEPRNDMYFMFRGQRLDIMYFMPNYKKDDTIEYYCKLVLEEDKEYGEVNKFYY